jgi:hypothetical protein
MKNEPKSDYEEAREGFMNTARRIEARLEARILLDVASAIGSATERWIHEVRSRPAQKPPSMISLNRMVIEELNNRAERKLDE